MKYYLRLKFVLVYYFFYMSGFFACAWFAITGSRVGTILAVLIPTIIVGIYLSLIVNQVKAAKKPKPIPRRTSSPVARRNIKVEGVS